MNRHCFTLTLCALISACDLSRSQPPPHFEADRQPAFRLLILEETSDRTRLPASQQAIFTSVTVRHYLKTHCEREPDGTAAFRIFDKDAQLHGDWSATVRAHPPQAYPWLYVTNGTNGYSGPLPKSVAELLSLIKPYAGFAQKPRELPR